MKTDIQPVNLLLSPGDNINSYVQTISQIPLLTVEEEKQLAENLYYREDLASAQKLILSHLRFVVHIARSYNGYGLAEADLIQEGNVGLMKAVKRYNPERGVRLVSFAVHWIKAEIHEFILRNWRIVKVATTKAQRKLFFNLRSAKKRLAWLTNDEAAAIAHDLGVDVKDVRTMEGRMTSPEVSFDPRETDDEDEQYAPAYYLEDHSLDPARLNEDTEWELDQRQKLAAAMEILDERSRDILEQRWVEETKLTLHDLADKYGVSAERIRQLEQNAMKKLRKAIEAA